MRKFRWILPLLLIVCLVLSVPAAQAREQQTKVSVIHDGYNFLLYATLDDITGQFTNWSAEFYNYGSKEPINCTKTSEGEFFPGSCIHSPNKSITLSFEHNGKTYEHTFVAANTPLGHIWDQEWTIDTENGTHYYKCLREGCTKRNSEENHKYELLRYDETGHWEECVCGLKETEPQPHDWVCKIGEDDLEGSHYQVCSFCEYADDPVPHQYELTSLDEEYHIWICTCGAVKPETDKEPHDYVLTDVGEGYHMWKCACGAVKPETDAEPHKYGGWTPVEDTDTHNGTCACGAETNESHEWGEWLSVDPYSHQRNCTMCGAFESEGHQYENGICTVCERKCTHEGGKATCIAKAVCDLCGLEYGDFDLTNHDLEHHDAQPATCTEIGWDAYDTCKREGCDYTTYEEIDKLGHDLEHHDAKPATCTEIGWDAYDTCKREGCDYTTYEEIDKLGHDLVHHDAKPATCTEIGWEAYDTCKRESCDYSTYKEIAALGHDLVKHDAQPATCTEIGWDSYDTCKREGCDYTTYEEIDKLGHDLEHHDAQPATCTEIGWDAYDTCSRCDYSTYEEIPALGHDIEHHDAKAATCTEDGWPAYDTCKRGGCDYTTLLVKQAKLGHDIVRHDAKAATCTEVGWEAYDTCKREGCDYTTYQEIPALGHDLEHHDAQAATCTDFGWEAYDRCTRQGCDYSTFKEIPALGHDIEHHAAKAATCTEDGWPAYDTCKREGCDYTTLLMMQAKLGHDLVHHESKAATCTEVGWEAYDTCSRCDYSTYKEIPALGHDLVKHDAKAATCTEAGWDAYDSCSRCDYSTYKEIPALGHDIEHHAAKAATCTEDGWPAYDTCKREGCNYTTLLIMQARLGHDLVHHEAKAATCTEAGWEAYDTCKREGCDYTTYKEIPALGHDLTHHEGKAATCTEDGWDAYDTCSRCSYTTYREIAAPGHTPGEPVVTAREEPQVGKAGFEETMICCTVCGLDLEYSYNQLPALPEPVPVPDTKEETPGKPDAEIVIAPKKTVLRIIQPEFLEEEQELEHSIIQQFFSDDSGVYFQTEPDSVLPNIPPYALKLIEAKVCRLEKFSDLADRVSLDYTGSQEFPLNLDLIMILVYRDDAGEHWEVLKKPTRLFGNRLRAEVDAALVRKLQSRPFAIIILADNGSR